MSAILAAALAQSAATAALAPLPTGEALAERVEANDARLFWGFFEGCDPDAVAELLHPEFRMVHDLAGLAHDGAEDILASAREQCGRRGAGGEAQGYRNRRLFVPGSRRVQTLGDWGVLEEGHHTFHEWRGSEKRWEQTGGGRYIHVWKWMPAEARLRLLDSISVDHGAAPAYPPAG